jgi:hypothetical protein
VQTRRGAKEVEFQEFEFCLCTFARLRETPHNVAQ